MLKITKQSITLTKGDDATIQLIPRYKDKTAYVFLEGDRGVFRLKTGNTLIEKECDIYQDPNKMVVSFQPADTINLKPGIYRYEVELITIYGFHYTFIADQTFIIGNEYEQRLQASGSNGSGNAGSNLPEVDGELTEDPVVSGEIQPTNPSVDYNNLTNKPKLNGVQIAGNHDNAYYGIPTELADLTADADHRTVSDTEKETWNAKSDFSGSYNDLTDVPEDLVEDAEYVHTDNNYTGAEKTKLGDIESGAEVNVQADWNETDTSSDAYIQNKPTIPAAQVNSDWNASSGVAEILHKPTLGTAAAKDYTGSVLENSTDLVESGAVKTAIDNAISSVYKPAGNKACAELVSALLIAANLGNVYNMTDDGVTTADFVEGAGKAIEAGDNVVIVDIGSSVYKFDLLSGMVDLSNYVQKSSTAGLIKNDGTIDITAYAKQNEMSVSASGDRTTIQLKNGTSAEVLNAHQDISGKANKSEMFITDGTGADADKTTIQLKDGLSKAVLISHQDISGKAEKSEMSVTDGTGADADKTTIQLKSGTSATVLKTHQDISGKADKVSDATNGNLAGLDANGNLTDSGIATTDVEEMQDELSTDYATIEGNPLNFTTLSAQTAKSTILSVEPIQDLHGYDKPWVGGAGKNVLPTTVDRIKAINSWITWSGNVGTVYGITVTILTDDNDNVIGIKVNGTATDRVNIQINNTSKVLNALKSGTTYIMSGCPANGSANTYFLGWYINGKPIDIDSGSGSSFTFDGTESTDNNVYIRVNSGVTVNNLIFYPMFRKSTDSADFEPYTNICPISGRSEIGILGCGGSDATVSQGARQSDGSISVVGDRCHSSIVQLQKGIQYLCKVETSVNGKTVDIAYQTWANAGTGSNTRLTDTGWLGANTYKVTPTSDTNASLAIRYNDNSNLSASDLTIKISQISNDITLSFGQTVYGGTLDVENGVLVVDRASVDLGDLTWAYNNGVMRSSVSGVKMPPDYNTKAEIISEIYEVDTSYNVNSSTTPYTIAIHNVNEYLWVYDPRYSDPAIYKTAMDGIQLCYALATPITINLTPHTINLLKGVNNISTDGDKITLTYRDGSVATLGDLTSAVDNLDSKIDQSKILTDTVTGDKYILVVTNGVLDIQQISN